ncbi:MAG: YigZ family protein [Clostridia bacterium]|nr:YigZ family protein [Clostridia bacterium]MBQ8772545.1 YigZ family protein [Clostridia bacterium]MBQ8872362.1 YigZ family protein [Clostridia bacterium]MBQ9707523.1 YigZ family protein [Clostridia bacterium]
MKEYRTIAQGEVVVTKVIEKSKFIAAALHVDTVEQAVEFVNAKKKKYFDATHNCYAYIVGDKVKFSDDGEPQGTAGMPILDCIKNNNLDFVCVVVTRYFGGIKLGAGGLVRAYSGSCADALHACQVVTMLPCERIQVVVDYSMLKVLRKALLGIALETDVVYSDVVTLQYLFPATLSTTITNIVTENTLGKGVLTTIEQLLYPWVDLQ